MREEAGCHYSHEDSFEMCEFEEGSKPFHLGGDRFVVVKKYRGVTYISIREFYKNKDKDDDKMLPGVRGINLRADEWWKITRSIMGISEAVRLMTKEEKNGPLYSS